MTVLQDTSGTGFLEVRTYTAREALPVSGVMIKVYLEGETMPVYEGETDDTGTFTNMSIPCPSKEYSLDENNTTVRPYALCSFTAKKDGFKFITTTNSQIFDTQTTLAELAMIPVNEDAATFGLSSPPDVTDIPPHTLWASGDASGASPLGLCPGYVLQQVLIPDKITVHLGKPASSAQNVTITFRDYIKNVASSEIYPTWPEQALRANIHAQISLALNRIFTEWYRSKGYNFQITNSTSYDQYYVHGRTIFDVMSRITDDIFNTYVRKTGTIDPYYTEYCDGKQVTCPGMKQWGTVTQANAGKNALQILRYYYGNDIDIIRTNNIGAVPESYPGTPLTIGSTGQSVSIIQRQLNRISKNYPFLGTLTVDGVFGTTTAEVVKKFQKQFNLTQDGIVGRSTWYKISYIYVAVKKLAELTSEGEKPTGELVAGQYPGTPLRAGSRGDKVMEMQFYLQQIAIYVTEIPTVSPDGIFGAATTASVRAFQRKFGLTVDGIVGLETWTTIYEQFKSLENDIAPPGVDRPGQYPGTLLTLGSTGNSVKLMQYYLRIIAQSNTAIPVLTADGIFGPGTEATVRTFQSFYGLTVDGIVGKLTWDKIYEVYTDLLNDLLDPSARPGTYPGTPLRLGSRGQSVKEMQYYLYLLSAYYSSIPKIAYDGIFGTDTDRAVRAYQTLFTLTVDGVVGPATWNSIYSQFSILRNVDGPVLAFEVFTYPGYDLKPGMEGDMVKFVQFMLSYVGEFYDDIAPIEALTGIYDEETEDAVRSFQRLFGEKITGVVDETTWNALVIVYLSLAGDAGSQPTQDGAYPGYVLTIGSAGQAVQQLQIYMNGIASRYCVAFFVPESGVFETVTLEAVKEFQAGFELPVTGIVDELTWDAIYNFYILEG